MHLDEKRVEVALRSNALPSTAQLRTCVVFEAVSETSVAQRKLNKSVCPAPDLSRHEVVPARFHSARGLRLGGFVIHSNLSNVGHLLAALQQ
jgi:hypothetical protein